MMHSTTLRYLRGLDGVVDGGTIRLQCRLPHHAEQRNAQIGSECGVFSSANSLRVTPFGLPVDSSLSLVSTNTVEMQSNPC